ncbi:MAG: TIGR00300 family protein, partial [Planctomycetales bacterium]|nr:TIGR00300 family protein [Planctomycetales bacterium]
MPRPSAAPSHVFVEEVEVEGHIIDSLILPKILDLIIAAGGKFRIKQISIGQARNDPSYALVEVSAPSGELLEEIVDSIGDHGATPTNSQDCRLVEADIDGAFPEGFYSTTNQRTEVRRDDHWRPVADQEMDCGIVVDPASGDARCLPMTEVRRGQSVVVGHMGVRVFPVQRQAGVHGFEFMNSAVSTEKPKGVAIRQIARELFDVRAAGGKSAIVGGPAIVHTGSGEHLCQLLRRGYVGCLLAG